MCDEAVDKASINSGEALGEIRQDDLIAHSIEQPDVQRPSLEAGASPTKKRRAHSPSDNSPERCSPYSLEKQRIRFLHMISSRDSHKREEALEAMKRIIKRRKGGGDGILTMPSAELRQASGSGTYILNQASSVASYKAVGQIKVQDSAASLISSHMRNLNRDSSLEH